MISGTNATGQTGTVERINFADSNPRWEIIGSILQPLATTKAVLLPTGKVLIGHGVLPTVPVQPGRQPGGASGHQGVTAT